jgi:hypothetical protein
MDKNTYEELKMRLDNAILSLRPETTEKRLPRSLGAFIHKNMDVSKIPKDKLELIHTMLHMFYQNHSGRGLTPLDIEDLHRKVVSRLDTHLEFDILDTK